MTLGYNWTEVGSWEWIPGTGFKIKFILEAKLNSQNVAENYSVVDTKLKSVINQGSGSGNNYYFWITGCSNPVSGNQTWYFASEDIIYGSYRVYHNNSGYGSSSIYAEVQVLNAGLSKTGITSSTFNLPTIARYFTSTPKISVASTTTTSAKFNWSTSETCNWVRYHLDGSSSWIDVFSGSAKSGSFTINNLKSNSSHKVYVECRRADSGLWSNSNTVNFKTSSKTGHLKINGENKDATPYVRINGEWKIAIPYVKKDGEWKRGK